MLMQAQVAQVQAQQHQAQEVSRSILNTFHSTIFFQLIQFFPRFGIKNSSKLNRGNTMRKGLWKRDASKKKRDNRRKRKD